MRASGDGAEERSSGEVMTEGGEADGRAGLETRAATERENKHAVARSLDVGHRAQIDQLGAVESYGGVSLHEQSHGESFFALLDHLRKS